MRRDPIEWTAEETARAIAELRARRIDFQNKPPKPEKKPKIQPEELKNLSAEETLAKLGLNL